MVYLIQVEQKGRLERLVLEEDLNSLFSDLQSKRSQEVIDSLLDPSRVEIEK